MLGDTISTIEDNIEVTDYSHERMAACLLIMAAAVLLGRKHPDNTELQYIAKSLAHPILVMSKVDGLNK